MTEIFKFTSLARSLLPIEDGDDQPHAVTLGEKGQGENMGLVKIQRQGDRLSVFWEDELIIKSTNFLVDHFNGAHLTEATQVLMAFQNNHALNAVRK